MAVECDGGWCWHEHPEPFCTENSHHQDCVPDVGWDCSPTTTGACSCIHQQPTAADHGHGHTQRSRAAYEENDRLMKEKGLEPDMARRPAKPDR